MKKVFLEKLPRKCGMGATKNKLVIDWENSKGYKIHFIYDDIEGDIEVIDYIRKKQQLIIKYNNKEKHIRTSGILKCQLGSVIGKITKEFKYEIGQRIVDDKRDITITDRKVAKANNGQCCKYYQYYCNKCTFDCKTHYSSQNKEYKEELWILEGNLDAGKGCSCCCFAAQIVVSGINDIATTHPWLIPIIDDLEFCKTHSFCTDEKVFPMCPSCETKSLKKIVPRNINFNYSNGCKKCGDNIKYPNKFAFNLLEQLKLDFISEYSPEWVGKKRYDFYFRLNNQEYIIEMDGGFHNKDNNMSGQTKEESQFIDDEKDRLAKKHGIEVIRIDCDYEQIEYRYGYIKQNILNDKRLNELFDLSNIDWDKINEFACGNLVKTVCDLWNQGIHDRNEIINITKLSKGAILNYLHIGANLNWCNYDPKEELRKSAKKNRPCCSKPIEIFKDKISLGIFKSANELSRQSEKLFKYKLNPQGIGKVCLGKQKKYKGYTFKYVS